MELNIVNFLLLILGLFSFMIILKPKNKIENLDNINGIDPEAIKNLSSMYNKGEGTAPAKLTIPNDGTINGAGRLHISGPESLYLLNKNGVIIGKEWGGNGNLSVQGSISGPTINAINGNITNVRNRGEQIRGEVLQNVQQNVQQNRAGCNWNGWRGIWGDHGKEDDYNMLCSGGKLVAIHATHP